VAISVIRGLVREVLSLASWIGAFFVARYGAVVVAGLLPDWVSHPSARLAIGFVLVMIAAVLLFSVISLQIGKVVKITGLQGTDRALGALFGFARGLVISVIAVLLAGMTSLPKSASWQNALLSAPMEAIASVAQPWLPQEIRSRIRYD
jgi:membrane protein required for colicin V production